MSNQNGRIFIDQYGVSIGDVQTVLSLTSPDLGYLIKNGSINKWAYGKPVRLNLWRRPTDAEISSVNCGLSPVSLSRLVSMNIGISSPGSYSEASCRSQIAEWTYLRPRGKQTYNEPFRLLDFVGYNHNAVAPDSGWSQMSLDYDTLTELGAVDITVTETGAYTGYNFKLTPRYNSQTYGYGLYSGFAIRFGQGSGESIGDVTNKEIPVEYVVPLDGNWRLALAVCIPDFHGTGKDGWGIFASRMTIRQFFAEGGGTNIAPLLPDFATNPYVAQLMAGIVGSQGATVTFDAVPLLVKDLGYTTINGVFCLRCVDNVTVAYCMPSGADAVAIVCGTPPAPVYWQVSYDTQSGVIRGFITNTDQNAGHTFGYRVLVNGSQTSTGTAVMSAGETRQVAGTPTGNNLTVEITSQDGTPV